MEGIVEIVDEERGLKRMRVFKEEGGEKEEDSFLSIKNIGLFY